MPRGKALAALALGVMGWLVAAAALAQPETRVLKIGTARDPQLATELIVAKEKGYFKEQGLEIDIAFFISGAEMTGALAAKQLVIGSFGDVPAISLRAGGNPVRIIAQMADISGAQQVVVKPEIKVPTDLKGKRVALKVSSSSEALFNTLLARSGMSRGDVEVLNMDPPEQVAAFARGDVQGICVWEPFVLKAKEAGGHTIISANRSFIPGHEGPTKYAGMYSVLVVREEFLAENPRTVEAVLRALVRATDFVQQHPDETARLLTKDIRQPLENIRVIMGENRYDMAITPELVGDFTKTIEFMGSIGKLKTVPKMEDWVDAGPLSRVRPEWVRWRPR